MINSYRGGIATAIIVILGAIAMLRIDISTTDEATRNELIVHLVLPNASDIDEVTRSSIVPIESAIRNVVTAERISGLVFDDGAWLRISLARREDSTAKAARLSNELEEVRRRLPSKTTLRVYDGGEGATDEVMLLLMRGERSRTSVLAVREVLLDLPGIRDVRLIGVAPPAIDLHLMPGTSPDIALAIENVIQGPPSPGLGTLEIAGRRVPLQAARDSRPIERRTVPAGNGSLPIAELATVRYGDGPMPYRLRVDGREAAGLILYRESNADIFDLDRDVEDTIDTLKRDRGIDLEIIENKAAGVSLLLRRWFVALVAASLLIGILTLFQMRRGRWGIFWASIFIPWVAGSGAVLALFLAGTKVGANQLAITIMASTLALPFAFVTRDRDLIDRLGHLALWIGTLCLIPAAIEIISSVALLEISTDAVLLVITASGSAGALVMLPQSPPVHMPHRVLRGYRGILAGAATTLLAIVSALFVAFTLFGGALDPRHEAPAERTDSLRASIQFPEDGSMERARELVETAEREVRQISGVERVVTRYDESSAELRLELDHDRRGRHSYLQISLEVQYRLAGRGFGISIDTSEGNGSDLAFTPGKIEPSTDPDAFNYRAVLRSSSADAMRVAIGRVRDRAPSDRLAASQVLIRGENVRSRLEMIPRADTPDPVRAEIARVIEESSGSVSSIPLAGELGGTIDIRPHWSVSSGEPRELDAMLHQPTRAGEGAVHPARWVMLREQFRPVSMPREDGQFTQVVSIDLPWRADWLRQRMRDQLHRGLRTLTLPHGVDLHLPDPDQGHFNERRLRMLGLYVLTPILFLIFGMFALNQTVLEPAAAMVPALSGTAAGAIFLRITATELSAAAILALLAIAAVSLYVSITLLRRGLGAPGQKLTVAGTYRSARNLMAPVVTGALLIAVVVGVLSVGVDSARFSWKTIFALTTVSATAALATSLVLPACALLLLVDVRKLPATVEQHRHKTSRWRNDDYPASLSVRSLTKIYPNGYEALSTVSFEVEPSIVALLGPNGAGKSTLIRLLTGLLQPTRGELRFKGDLVEQADLPLYRGLIGYLPQEFNAYPQFSAEQFLDYWALEMGIGDRLRRNNEIEQILLAVGLDSHAGRKVREFSGGMRQRVGIARALLEAPPVLIVDEPTTGLDIESRQRLRGILRSISAHRIVILSTHIASDVEGTASRVLLLNQGRLRFDGTPSELTHCAEGRTFEATVDDDELRRLSREYRITARVRTVDGVRIRGVALTGQSLPGEPVPPRLEEGYLTLIDETSGPRGDRGRHYDSIREIFTGSASS